MNKDDMIEILDDINENDNGLNQPFSSTNVEPQPNPQMFNQTLESNNIEPNPVNYDPIENHKEEIKIEQESKSEENKSGLGFVIVLFVIIGAFIVALPYIAKLLR